MAESALIGNPDTIRKRLAAFEVAGAQELIVGFPDALQLDSFFPELSGFVIKQVSITNEVTIAYAQLFQWPDSAGM